MSACSGGKSDVNDMEFILNIPEFLQTGGKVLRLV
jgi:hypothetical protein